MLPSHGVTQQLLGENACPPRYSIKHSASRRTRAKIQAVATDMSAAYIRAVRDNLPKAVHVFDHFHVIKLFNEKLSALRRELYQQASRADERQILKGTRWLLLKNPENLDEGRDEQQRLAEALRLNKPLATAYYL